MQKVIYATDLDRTVIFSDRFVREYNIDLTKCVIAEQTDQYKAFINRQFLALIKNGCEYRHRNITGQLGEVVFIPVTSRSIAEYTRLDIQKYADYAIVTNGCHILKNGQLMDSYEKHLNNEINWDEFRDSAIKCIREAAELDKDPRIIDDRYIFAKVADNSIDTTEKLIELNKKYNNLTIQRNGRKLYVTPRNITKSTALDWLRHEIRLDNAIVVASGDSVMDKDLVKYADIKIVPAHGDINKHLDFEPDKIVQCGPDGAFETLIEAIKHTKSE